VLKSHTVSACAGVTAKSDGGTANATVLVLGNLSTPKSVQKLQAALHAKARAEAGYRFYAGWANWRLRPAA
jgi:hypothetical protein